VSGEFARCRQFGEAVGEPEAVAHPVVVHRQHIRPPELEHQHHLHRPRTDAAHLREPGDDFRVRECGQRRAVRHHAREGVRREIFERGGLRCGEPDRTQPIGRCGMHLCGGGEVVAGARVTTLRIQRDEAREDGVGGTAADLLRGDGLHEMPERRVAGFGAQPIRAHRLDQRRHHGVDAPEMRQQRTAVGRARGRGTCPRRARHLWHDGHQ